MILGQRLNSIHSLLGQKIHHPAIQLGQKIISNANKARHFVNSAENINGEVKKIYSNLEKLNARKRLH
jgi:3'-phosphoadenosine 5'-phosphosulfate sulfotransferase